MNTIKVVADHVPKEKVGRLAAGKIYAAERYGGGWNITNDLGWTNFILLIGCSHLNGGSWRIVE